MLMTGAFSHNEGTLTVHGVIEGVFCPMVVDTGANVTVARPDLLDTRTPSRIQASTSLLKTATGESANLVLKLMGHKYGMT